MCGETKDRSEFYKSKDGKYGPILKPRCKACDSAQAREWFAENSDRAKENRRRWNLENFYGLSVADYNDLLRKQGGVCAICSRPERMRRGEKLMRMPVDHDHKTGAVRGILCQTCNRAIGLLGDDAVLMRRAISYLLRHRNQQGE
ncbi:endonuclease VII domain-containing protein [Streptomyces sp. TRM72054]|uniref:endonuclease VII domain-containing protein n=1 Tax=Streptomyces sp. TRM72054 TaxID=2870562 RepID=UPI001C8BDBE4|nr:endonuclease VII domain-containing protein [Streptomyces sp. TRM72054]MBX9392282.1 endonuclease VII domain-containing protein [Streptomyces sp. TRM72054]